MSKYTRIGLMILALSLFYFCNKKTDNSETILKGKINILVDETLTPIIDDEIAVFESDYLAKIITQPKSEAEVLRALFKDSLQIAVLSRKLSEKELSFFENKKIAPRQSLFATDAIAFISNKSNNDTLIALQDVINFMQGKSQTNIKGLVFDNPNSSTVRYMNQLAGLKTTPETGIYSFKNNEEVIKHVSENSGMIGVVGINWLSQPNANIQKYKDNVSLMSVKAINGNAYFYPNQNNLAEKKYPLARDLYIINCQGFSGLGMGFSSFVAGERGQRIILKSGLLPWKIPSRSIAIRKTINNDKK
jgi:phosphate transport system substrate-binding protein